MFITKGRDSVGQLRYSILICNIIGDAVSDIIRHSLSKQFCKPERQDLSEDQIVKLQFLNFFFQGMDQGERMSYIMRYQRALENRWKQSLQFQSQNFTFYEILQFSIDEDFFKEIS